MEILEKFIFALIIVLTCLFAISLFFPRNEGCTEDTCGSASIATTMKIEVNGNGGGGSAVWTEKIRKDNPDGTYYYVYKDYNWNETVIEIGEGGWGGGNHRGVTGKAEMTGAGGPGGWKTEKAND